MFLPALLSSLLFAQLAPAIPATAPDPDYPIHVQLAQVGVTGGTYLSYYGRGNIIGDNPTGFDYASDCYRQLGPIQNRDPNAVYQARWKKQDQRLEILLQEIGSTHTSRCELKSYAGADSLPTQYSESSLFAAVHRGDRAKSRLPTPRSTHGYALVLQQQQRFSCRRPREHPRQTRTGF